MTDFTTMNIEALFNYKQNKSQNDAINKEREKKLVLSINANESNSIVNQIRDQFTELGLTIISCSGLGGRNNSCDFKFRCRNEKNKVQDYTVELKVVSGVIPQLCDIYLKNSNEFINGQYNTFVESWHTKFEQIKKEFKLEKNIPTIEDLSKGLCATGTSNIEFLEELKNKIKSNKTSAAKLNRLSQVQVHEFIENNFDNFDTDKILELYRNKIECKDFIIKYNKKTKKIKVLKIDKMEIDIERIEKKKAARGNYNIGINATFKIVAGDEEIYEDVEIRLRWKNRNGLYGPAWKCNVIKCLM